jgi:hypothetical protein
MLALLITPVQMSNCLMFIPSSDKVAQLVYTAILTFRIEPEDTYSSPAGFRRMAPVLFLNPGTVNCKLAKYGNVSWSQKSSPFRQSSRPVVSQRNLLRLFAVWSLLRGVPRLQLARAERRIDDGARRVRPRDDPENLAPLRVRLLRNNTVTSALDKRAHTSEVSP